MHYKLLFTSCLLFLLQTISSQNTSNTSSPCTELQYPCVHTCTVSNQSAVCSCNQGWYLHSNGYACVECKPGTYGHSCLQRLVFIYQFIYLFTNLLTSLFITLFITLFTCCLLVCLLVVYLLFTCCLLICLLGVYLLFTCCLL